MKKIITLKDAKCTSLELSAPIEFMKGDEDKGNNFLIEAYTGEVVDRWWGKLAVSVDGIKAGQNMPILRDHQRGQIVGYSQKSWKDGSFFLSGKFSNVTPVAAEVKGLAEEGFPWKASIGVKPLKVLSLEPGEKEKVNGKTLKGPAEIWLESRVEEASFVPLGADSNTSVSTFSKIEEVAPEAGDVPGGAEHKSKKGEDMEITLSLLEKDASELLEKIRTAAKAEGLEEGAKKGAADELSRIKAVSEQLMIGHEDLISKLMFDGKTTGPEAAMQVLAAEKKIRDTALENLNSGAAAPVNAVTAPETEDLDDGQGEDEEFDEDKAAAKFKASKTLKQEFGDQDTYFAYLKATNDGQVKVLKHK